MESVDYSVQGTVFDIQRFSIHDGPGIRTIVFLKGCPLRCKWCSNPESQQYYPEVLYRKQLCIGCKACQAVCPKQAIADSNPYWVDRTLCDNCAECTIVCPTSALSMKGKLMTVEEVVKELRKDATQYFRSNGGITLSGGEALTQPIFAKEIFKACKAQGWHTAIETEGYYDTKIVEEIMPYIDLVLLDIKSVNPEQHKKFTGVDNAKIRESAKVIQSIANTTVRVPTIPGFNASEEDIRGIAEFVKESMPNVHEVHLLPYHNYGQGKYELLGREYELEKTPKIPEEEMEKYKKILEIGHSIRLVLEGLAGRSVEEEALLQQEGLCKDLEEKLDILKDKLSTLTYQYKKMGQDLDLVASFLKDLANYQTKMDSILDLERVLRGNKFVEYLAQAYLQNIVYDASQRLDLITSGRYALEIDGDYAFVIRDNYKGGLRRSADTLSGGENFLVSLSLALALSSQIQLKGSAPLEFFFLDEGFGSLDRDLLDTVMTSLERLQGENMSVGIISHVEELKNMIPVKLEVEFDEIESSSKVKLSW